MQRMRIEQRRRPDCIRLWHIASCRRNFVDWLGVNGRLCVDTLRPGIVACNGDDMTGKFSPNSWRIIILFRGILSSTRVRFPLSTWRRHVLPVTWRQVALPLGMCVCTLSCKRLQKSLVSCWDGRLFGHNTYGPKSGGCCALFRGGAGSPSNTMLPGPRHYLNFAIAAICDYTIV